MVLPAPSHSGRCLAALLLVVLGLSGASRAAAADKEVRDFVNYIDGKKAGTYKMTITTDDKGTVTMMGEADIALKFLLRNYTYWYRGTEVWNDGRLTTFDSKSNDDGKQYTVKAVAGREGQRVTVNGRERVTRGDVWVTTYWRLPDAKFRGQPVALLDADTGRDLNGTLQYVGSSQLTIAGQPLTCAHYRVTGDVTVDFWYDDSERLVRQEWIEDKHTVLLQLTSLGH
jgi:hypothetical protein